MGLCSNCAYDDTPSVCATCEHYKNYLPKNAAIELDALRAFHDYFLHRCESLFSTFGMDVIELYNTAYRARQDLKHDDEQDGALFRFWIDEAARNPARVAIALANCATPDDYRKALRELMNNSEAYREDA